MRWRKVVLIPFAAVMLLACVEAAPAANSFYVAPTATPGTPDGTIDHPWTSFATAITAAQPGDTIFARGGTYNLSSTITIAPAKSGTANNQFKLFAYPGESPVLDFRTEPYNDNNQGVRGIILQANYWHIKGLTVQYAADNGIFIPGSNNIVEQVVARQNQDSGFQISTARVNNVDLKPANNLLLNCDSYANFDFGNEGENADGFAIKFRGLGPGNVVDGARSWENADDGFDFWQAENRITVKNSWSFHNGVPAVFNNPANYQGDSNGVKLGHDSANHVLQNMLIWGNIVHGIDINGNATDQDGPAPEIIPHGVTAYNITAAGNGSRNYNYDEDPTSIAPPAAHILRNNISFNGTTRVDAGNTASHNTFNGPGGTPVGLGATAADFVSTVDPVLTPGNYHPAGTLGDRDGTTLPVHATGLAVAPRLSDGSLPLLDFMRLKAGSHLIDAGTNVGLTFFGNAPDLGWLETGAPPPPLPGDFNGNESVDLADYVVWRKGYGTVYFDDDYALWRGNFGRTSASGSGVGNATAVPEPASMLLLVSCLLIHVLGRVLTSTTK